MKICPKCGAACADGDIFCGTCGYHLNESESAADSAQSQVDDSKSNVQNDAQNSAQNSGYGTQNSGYGAPNSGYGAPNSGYGAPNSAYRVPNGAPNGRYGAPNNAPNGAPNGRYGGNVNPNAAYTANSPKNNPFAVVSLILGIASIPTLWCCGLGFLLAVAAIIFGCVARGQIRESNGRQTGIGFCTAGLVLGIITGVLFVVSVIVICALGAWGSILNDISNNQNSFESGLMFFGLL